MVHTEAAKPCELPVLEFLQECFMTGLSRSTLKVHLVALGAYRAPLGSRSVGAGPLVTHFLCGTRRLRLARQLRFPSWDQAMVLGRLCDSPF